jgi:hypothetical protein
VIIGLLHAHSTLAYLIFLVSLVDLILVLGGARTNPQIARGVALAERFGLVWAGRVNLLLGIAFVVASGYDLTRWWLWVSLLLWGPVEVLSKRLVQPGLRAAADGGQPNGKLTAGAVGQLLIIAIIFGLMSARP